MTATDRSKNNSYTSKETDLLRKKEQNNNDNDDDNKNANKRTLAWLATMRTVSPEGTAFTVPRNHPVTGISPHGLKSVFSFVAGLWRVYSFQWFVLPNEALSERDLLENSVVLFSERGVIAVPARAILLSRRACCYFIFEEFWRKRETVQVCGV